MKLTHFSYDSPWNPWFSGGGAQKDWEILKRLTGWQRRYAVGGFENAPIDPVVDDVQRLWIGTGRGRWSSRISYASAAQRYARENAPLNDELWSISPSVFAPVPQLLHYPERTAISLFHLVGWNAWKKYGPIGLLAVWHEQQIIHKGQYFLCINNATKYVLQKKRPDARIYVVPTGFSQLNCSGKSVGLGKKFEVLFFGRLDVYMKGLDRLVNAFHLLAPEFPEWDLILAGRGDADAVQRVQDLFANSPYSSRIRIEGNVDPDRKGELFQSADIFCSPSRFEGWCIAAVEAQSCGLPVVASTADGFLDSVANGESGILVDNAEQGFVERLSATLRTLITDKELRLRLGAKGILRSQKFTWNGVAAEHDAIYRGILESRC